MKASTDVRVHVLFLTGGSGGGFGATNAQCGATSAPAAIQRRSVAFWTAVRVLFDVGGGMTISASSLKMRWTTPLWSGFPGTTAPFLIATARSSSRSLAERFFSSGPWHLKHLSDNIGRTSRE